MDNDSVRAGGSLAASTVTGRFSLLPPVRAEEYGQTASTIALAELSERAVRSETTLQAKFCTPAETRLQRGHWQNTDHHHRFPFRCDTAAKG
jgi:uncharacterized protein (DUF2342 family)